MATSEHAWNRALHAVALRWEHVPANDFGAFAGLVGILAGEVAAAIVLSLSYVTVKHGQTPSMVVRDAAGLVGLWLGFVATALLAGPVERRRKSLRDRLVADLGLSFRWSDLPIGVVAGLFGQFVLVLVLELPLYPFVPHLFQRLGAPARSLTSGESGTALALLGVLVCLGSPLVEELFFRGLFLRGLLGKARGQLGLPAVPAVLGSAALSGLVFGLVHFEALQLLALSGFGVLLALLACSTGRLGAGVVAHITFNTVTFITLATNH
jgi:membrane protease YdiL (CAAX protease family)